MEFDVVNDSKTETPTADLAAWLTRAWGHEQAKYERATANPYSRYLLAWIATGREILELHAAQAHPLLSRGNGRRYPSDDLRPVCGECSGDDDPYVDQVAYPCETVRLLAQPYADRAGFREEWR